jgi:hypothetical protein
VRLVLAYPWRGYRPDDVVDVDAKTGRRLLRDGKARPEPTPAPAPDEWSWLTRSVQPPSHGDATHEETP